MVKWIAYCCFIVICVLPGKSQTTSDIAFIQHLIDNREFEDAIRTCQQVLPQTHGSKRDSICFLKGWSFYSLKSLDSASYWMDRVSVKTPVFSQSLSYSAYCKVYQGKLTDAKNQLKSWETNDSSAKGLKKFQLAGIALLERDFQTYENFSIHFTHAHYSYAREEDNLNNYYQNLRQHHFKSPVLAGCLSALVPGSGKFYAGKRAQGFSSFFIHLTLAGLATENIVKSGWKSPQSILFSGLFSVFYIGNIYGSVFAVKYVNDAYNQNINGHLLLDLHLPLRSFFR